MSTYYIQWKGVIDGPFQAGSILQMLASNRISKMHLISSDRRQWVPLGRSAIYAEANRAVAFNVAQSEQSNTQNSSMVPSKPLEEIPNGSRKISKGLIISELDASTLRQNETQSQRSVASNQSSPAFITGLCAVLGVITLVVILVRQPETSRQRPEYPPQVRDATIVAWAAYQSVAGAPFPLDKNQPVIKFYEFQAYQYCQINLVDVDSGLKEHIGQRYKLCQELAQLISQLQTECVKIQENTEAFKAIGALFGLFACAETDPLAGATVGASIAEILAKAGGSQEWQQIQQKYMGEIREREDKLKQMNNTDQVIADELSKKYQVSLKLQLNDGGGR
jgi:hypothetical protein